jgi:bacterioferritin-associated ferredoxin
MRAAYHPRIPLLGALKKLRRGPDGARPVVDDGGTGLVCYCRRVEYPAVREAIAGGAKTIADLQRETTACTRCFGCRPELERVLRLNLGAEFKREPTIWLSDDLRKRDAPRPMYMPVLAGFAGSEVHTRAIVFNWEGTDEPVPFRADLLRPDGVRVKVYERSVANGSSAIIDLAGEEVAAALPDGIGVLKLVLSTADVGSLRPYFHLVTPTGITTTHEKRGASDINRIKARNYHWVFPVGIGDRDEEAYFFATNPSTVPMPGELVWTPSGGEQESVAIEPIEFEQTACVALHEAFPAIRHGRVGGSVHLTPPTHTVAGFILRHSPAEQLWRVQHL